MAENLNKFLNYEGVSHLWNQVVANIKASEEAALAAAAAAQQDVDDLSALVGVIPEDASATSVVEYVQEKTANKADDLDWHYVNWRTDTYPAYGYVANAKDATNLVDIEAGMAIPVDRGASGTGSALGSVLEAMKALTGTAVNKSETIISSFVTNLQTLIENNVLTLPVHLVYGNNRNMLDNDYYRIDDSSWDDIVAFTISRNGVSLAGPQITIQNGVIIEDSFAFNNTLDSQYAAPSGKAVGDAIAPVRKAVNDLSAFVGEMPKDAEGKVIADTVIAYVDKKTEGIATDAALDELQGKVSTIEGDYLKSADIADMATKTEVSSTYETIANADLVRGRVDELEAHKEDYKDYADQAEADALAAAKEYADEVKKSILTGDAEDTLKSTYDTLLEIQTWIEGDGVNTTELTNAIAAEAKTRGEEITRVEGEMDDALALKGDKSVVEANTNAINAIKDDENIDSFADVVTALAGKQDTIEAMSTADIDAIIAAAAAGDKE